MLTTSTHFLLERKLLWECKYNRQTANFQTPLQPSELFFEKGNISPVTSLSFHT